MVLCFRFIPHALFYLLLVTNSTDCSGQQHLNSEHLICTPALLLVSYSWLQNEMERSSISPRLTWFSQWQSAGPSCRVLWCSAKGIELPLVAALSPFLSSFYSSSSIWPLSSCIFQTLASAGEELIKDEGWTKWSPSLSFVLKLLMAGASPNHMHLNIMFSHVHWHMFCVLLSFR